MTNFFPRPTTLSPWDIWLFKKIQKEYDPILLKALRAKQAKIDNLYRKGY